MKTGLLLLVPLGLLAQDISGERIRAHTRFLASDALEGRGVATRGETLATDYIATQFALLGLKPAGDHGTFFQAVPLVGSETQPQSRLSAVGRNGTIDFRWAQQFVGTTAAQKAEVEFDAPAIFVGHGIAAPEFGWDDYKGTDVTGKVVVLFTNEPPSDDPKFFGGAALTYYGRWSYKYEEALRRGAAAAIIIHTTLTAGYGWDVVRSSWGKEDPQVRLAAGAPSLALQGWITTDAAESMLAGSGYTVANLLDLANTPDFKPFPLGLNIRGKISTKIRDMQSRNVVGFAPGSDASEAVVFSAHWDHLGVGEAVNGDTIYNGAVDNATGCAMLLEMARAWSMLSPKPRRSAIFISVTAEEGGLRGSQYYALHPFVSPAKTALNLNFDGYQPAGRTKDIVVVGAERTTVWPLVQAIAKRYNFTITPDPQPGQGHYFRSDHFSMAKAGVPAFSIGEGMQFWGKPADYGEKMFEEFNSRHYHQPSDEYHAEWDFSGLEQIAKFGFALGLEVANQPKLPDWVAGDSFQRK